MHMKRSAEHAMKDHGMKEEEEEDILQKKK
jgi:hypothetical protein